MDDRKNFGMGPPIPGAPWVGVQPQPREGGNAEAAEPRRDLKQLPLFNRAIVCEEPQQTFFNKVSSLLNSLVYQGFLRLTGQNIYLMLSGAMQASRPPTKHDDVSQGYYPGNSWVDRETGRTYQCTYNAVGESRWNETSRPPENAGPGRPGANATEPTKTYTQSPLSGGEPGAPTGSPSMPERLFKVGELQGYGLPNQMVGMHGSHAAWEYKTLVVEDSNSQSITHSTGVVTFGLDDTLDALAVYSTPGLVTLVGPDVFTGRTIVGPVAGITVTDGDGVSGNPTLALANDLAALEAQSGTGLVARTASETYAHRTITGPAAGITVSNGGGIAGNPALALANDLAALEDMSGTGLVARTGSETYAQRTLTAPAAGITVSDGNGVSGNPTLALANDLAALEAMSGTGIVVRTGSETYTQRAIAGTADRVSVSNGDGVSGNPTIDVAVTYAGQGSITTVGTITSGTWNGTDIALSAGGTGASLSDPNADRILFWDDSDSTVTWLAPGTGVSISGTTISSTSTLLDGSVHTDTVAQTVSRGSIIYGNTTPAWDELVVGSAGQVLRSDGTDIAWQTWTLTAGNGLTGGGTLQADRTVAVGAGNGITVNADDVAVNQAYAFAWTGAHTHTVAGVVANWRQTENTATALVAAFQGDRSAPANNDEAYIEYLMSDDAGTQVEIARISWQATNVAAGSVGGHFDFWAQPSGSTLTRTLRVAGAVVSPSSDDGASLGSTSLKWSDVFLASGAVINFNSGDVTVTHSANTLAFAGASTGYTFDTPIGAASGGTGRASHTAYAVICGGTSSTGAQQSIASVGTSGQVLTSNGAGALPTFQNNPAAGTSALLDGSVHTDTVAQSVTRGSLIYGNSTPAWDELVKGSSNQFLQAGASDVSWVTMSGDVSLSGGTATVVSASDTAAGKIEIAVQSEQETGTDTTRAVTPGRQRFHPSAAKAWCTFDGSAAGPTNDAAFNCDSPTDNGTGDWTINWTTDFSSTAYCAVGTTGRGTAGSGGGPLNGSSTSNRAAGTWRAHATNAGGTLVDREYIQVVAFGDQA